MINTNYPVQVAQRARELAEAGWNAPQIQRMFSREMDRVPSLPTIRSWINEDFAARDRERVRKWRAEQSAAAATFALPSTRPEYRDTFIEALKSEGVGARQIARVLRVVGQPLDEKTVRQRLAKRKATA